VEDRTLRRRRKRKRKRKRKRRSWSCNSSRRSNTRRRRGTTKGWPGTTRMRWWGMTDLPQDPHPHADTGLATSFALL
jgi:hypothetical protein